MILKERAVPFLLSLFVVAADQITKFIIVKTIPLYSAGPSFFGDFFRIIHTRNKAVAFSLGSSIPENLKVILFSIIPFAVLLWIAVYIIRSDEITKLQRWLICGIIGGGVGNLIDRFFRPAGVVDFLDVKFYGLFGLDRWPTFNVADSAIVICGLGLVFAFLVPLFRKKSS